jgi:hypothetical protein
MKAFRSWLVRQFAEVKSKEASRLTRDWPANAPTWPLEKSRENAEL